MISSVLVGYVFFLLIFCFLFFYLNNTDVENCGEVRNFGFLYIYIYIDDVLLVVKFL